jgi:cytochrome oxidase assembly protein ShyY1
LRDSIVVEARDVMIGVVSLGIMLAIVVVLAWWQMDRLKGALRGWSMGEAGELRSSEGARE